MPWKTLNSEKIVENPFLTVSQNRCQKENGDLVEHYYVVERKDVVVIAALTPDKQLILIEQYRYPVKDICWEIPAGYVEDNENPKDASARELLEETGYKPRQIISLQQGYASTGLMDNSVHFFIGLDSEKIQEPELEPNEEITVHPTAWQKVEEMLEQGQIRDLGSLSGILLAKEYLEKNG